MANTFRNKAVIITLSLFCSVIFSFAQPLEWQGQVSSWLTINPDPKLEGQIGIRYIPTISAQKQIGNYLFDG
mgnify:CR=1 FL=1